MSTWRARSGRVLEEASHGPRERLPVREGSPEARSPDHRRRRALARAHAHLPRLPPPGRRPLAGRALQVQGRRARMVRDDSRGAEGQAAPPATWWGEPANTLDRATAMVPRLFYERLDDFGVDFCLLYTSLGLFHVSHPDD